MSPFNTHAFLAAIKHPCFQLSVHYECTYANEAAKSFLAAMPLKKGGLPNPVWERWLSGLKDGQNERCVLVNQTYHLLQVSLDKKSACYTVQCIPIKGGLETQLEAHLGEVSLLKMVENAHDIIFSINKNGRFIHLNNSAKAFIQSKTESFFDLIPNAFKADTIQSFWLQVKNKERSAYMEFPVFVKPDELTWMGFSIQLVDGVEGEAVLLIIARGISKRKKYEQQLKNTTKRFRTLIQSFETAILLEDQDQKIELVNEAFCNLFDIDYSITNLPNTYSPDLLEKYSNRLESVQDFKDTIRQILKNKKADSTQTIELKNGQILRVIYTPIFQQNEYTGHLWQFLDITEREKQEAALMAKEQKYRKLLENMRFGLLEMGLDQKVIFVNAAFRQFTGYEDEDLIGKIPENRVFKSILKIHKNSKYNPELTEFCEYQIDLKNGRKSWVLISSAPVYNENNQLVAVLFSVVDVNQRKKIEQELRSERERAQSLLKVKEQFLANISHEIRTPMNAIFGMTALFRPEKLATEEQKYLKVIKSSTHHLLALINDMLDFSKIQSGKLEIEEVSFNLDSFFQIIEESFKQKADKKGLKFNFDTNGISEANVKGDPTRLKQVLFNLIGNAIKFTEEGQVRVVVSTEQLDNGEKLRLYCHIIDTGPGIEVSKQEMIFESFNQSDSSVNRKYGGTGLGLSISKELTWRMGGKIKLYSRPGEGATFSVIIDLKKGQNTNKKAKPMTHEKELKPFRSFKVLIAEDHEFNAYYAQTLLKRWNLSTNLVTDGEKAIEEAAKSNYDLILMDIQMPKLSGVEATEQIRKQNADIPIIALTANSFKESLDVYLEKGMNDYVMKPFEPKILHEKLAFWLAKNHPQVFKHESPEPIASESSTVSDAGKNYDLNKLEAMSAGNKDFVKKMIGIFIKNNSENMQQIKAHFENKEAAALGDLAHKMKAPIDMLQIEGMGEVIRLFEDAGKNQDLDQAELPQKLEELLQALQQAEEGLQKDMERY